MKPRTKLVFLMTTTVLAASALQVMKPASGTCEVSQRLLGPGDLAGMKSIYP